MIHNAFSPHYVPEIKLKPNWKETQLANLSAKDREALALKSNPSAYITIGKQADTVKRQKMTKAAI
jgi:hypothetical protein